MVVRKINLEWPFLVVFVLNAYTVKKKLEGLKTRLQIGGPNSGNTALFNPTLQGVWGMSQCPLILTLTTKLGEKYASYVFIGN